MMKLSDENGCVDYIPILLEKQYPWESTHNTSLTNGFILSVRKRNYINSNLGLDREIVCEGM